MSQSRDLFAKAMRIDIGDESATEKCCTGCIFAHNRDLAQREEIENLRAELAEQKIRTKSSLDLARRFASEKRGAHILCCLIGAVALLALGQACGWVRG